MMQRFLQWVIAIVLLGIGLYIVWGTVAAESTGASTPFTEEITKRLNEIRKIQKVSPNLGILNDALFQALRLSGAEQPAGTSTPALSRGRTNPFIPF